MNLHNLMCILGATIATAGLGAYQTGYELAGIMALIVSIGLYALIWVIE